MTSKYLNKYLKVFENLNITDLDKLSVLLDDNIYFEDPFNKSYGKAKFIEIFKKSLTKVKNIKFKILKVTSKKNIFFVKWEMIFFAFDKQNKINGISEIILNKEGKICTHIDYWDSFNNFYLKIPIIGKFFSLILKIVKSKI